MKLINVDRVKKDLLAELLSGVDGGTDASWLKTYEVIDRIENIVNEWVDNQITVEAIPIEMRLIDVDNFLKQYSNQVPGDTIDAIDLRLALLKEPKVDAIPIEWIEKWLDTWTPDLPVAEMMKDWEKENESNN